MTTALPPRVKRLVAVLSVAAATIVGAALVALLRSPPSFDVGTLTTIAAFLAGFALLERLAVSFVWRGHRVSTALTEAVVFLGYVLLAPFLVMILVPLARVGIHFATRRPAIKGVFNVSDGAIAAGIGEVAFLGALAAGLPMPLAGAVATLLYSVSSEALVASLFSRLEGEPLARVYRERFMLSTALAVAIGIPSGFALFALHALHPVAIAATLPVFILLLRHSRLQASVDRELEVRRRLAQDARDLVGTQDESTIVTRVFGSCRELLDASRVRLRLQDGRAWEDEYEPSPIAREPLAAPVLGRDGSIIGTLEVWERPMKPRYGEEERALVHLVATQAAHAFESARALGEVALQRDLMARQEKLSALGTLMAGVAHEINNPLSFMKLRLHTARAEAKRATGPDSKADADTQALAKRMLDSLDVLGRGVDRLAGLSHSLKVVARPGDGQRRPTDFNDVVDQVMTILRAAARDVEFEVELAPQMPLVHANAAELHQVVLNLVKNGMEAIADQEERRIRVATRQLDHGAQLIIHDNGPGIPPDVQPRLFTPFFTTKEKGTGLGLSISHQIIAAHGGSLTFDTGPSGGTTFTLQVPYAPVVVAETRAS